MAPSSLDTGDAFGAYRLGDLVGRGGMGVVRRAEHVHLGRTVALKLLAPELTGNVEFRDRFLRESRLAAGLDHPNIVPVYDAGEVDGVLYLAMRFVAGTDLAAEIARRGPLPPAEAIDRVAQVGAALDAAHTHGLVHRDVKPANVMLDGDRAYLTDFGLTKQTATDSSSGLTRTGIFLGTVDYAAPEQIEGRAVDARTDVYALGCVLHECLTASRPYPRDSQVAVLYAHLHEDPPRPSSLRPELPAALDRVIATALAKRPDDRYPSCHALTEAARAAMTAVAGNERTAVRSPSPTTPAKVDPPTAPFATEALAQPPTTPAPIRTRRRALPIAVALAAVVAVGVVLALVLGGGGDDDPQTDTAARTAAEASPEGQPKVVGEPLAVGKRPFGVVVGNGVVWVANNSSNTVTRQSDDGGLRTDLEVGAEPFGIARNADSVWVSNVADGTVNRIDVATGTVGDPVKVGAKPYFLTADDATVFVSNGDSNTVTQLSAETGQPIGEPVAVGEDPRGIATSGSAVWVANRADGTVSRIVGGSVVKTFEVGKEPASVAFGADAIWVVNRADDTVTRIDVRAGGDFKMKTIDVGKEPFGVAFGEGSVWVTNAGDDTVTRIDPRSGEVTGEPIPVAGQPVGVSAARGFVWVTSNDAGTLTKIDPNG